MQVVVDADDVADDEVDPVEEVEELVEDSEVELEDEELELEEELDDVVEVEPPGTSVDVLVVVLVVLPEEGGASTKK